MVFSSLLFLFRFLPAMLFVYFITPKKARNLVLFLGSLIFYAWGEPVYVVLMLFSTVVDFIHGKLVHFFLTKEQKGWARLCVTSAVCINLLLLGFFKYGDFLISNINKILSTDIPLMELALPIGISFYTFQTMSYTIDIYRGQAKVQTNIINFGTYVALFPQLIAGPIVQYKTVAKQLNNRSITLEGFTYGIHRFIIGLGKKVLLANSIGLVWDQISSQLGGGLTPVSAWLGAFAFAFQIYFDFSGYSDMAIGLGAMLGFRFLENFNYPYMARSITDFWRRWHISLSTWFKEYVYIPLGGNQQGKLKQLRNISIVWLLTGIWHGASWNFVIWGGFFGVLLILEKLWILGWLTKLPTLIRSFYTIVLVCISWMIFAFDDLQKGISYIRVMFYGGGGEFFNQSTSYVLLTNWLLFLILIIGCTTMPKCFIIYVKKKLGECSILEAVLSNLFYVFVFLISVAYLVDATYNPFLYFRF